MKRGDVSRKTLLLVAVSLVAILSASSALACSCVSRTKEDRSEVREAIRSMLEGARNVVLLEAMEVTRVTQDHERAILRVVQSWKGTYSTGMTVRSDTDGIGHGECDLPIGVGQQILVSFDAEPIVIRPGHAGRVA